MATTGGVYRLTSKAPLTNKTVAPLLRRSGCRRGSPPALSIIHILGAEPRASLQLRQCSAIVMERSVPLRDGIEADRAECQRHAARHTQRRAPRGERRSARPLRRLPTAWQGWAETVAA